MMRTPTAMVLAMFATVPAACGGSDPGTSVEINLVYDDTLGLDTAEVTVVDRTESARIAHRLFLLVPDELAAMDMPIEVWGRKAGKRAAYGAATAMPVLGKTNTAIVTLSACSPVCQGTMLTTCTGPMVACQLGCSDDGDAHCIVPRPSNQVDPALADRLRETTTIAADATFNTDTGAVTGGLVRAPGVSDGRDDGVGYQQQAPVIAEASPLGIFVFHNLTINAGVTVRFTGSRAVVLLVGDVAKIGGTLDLAGGHDVRSAPGPGGGAGGTTTTLARGCGAGGRGGKGTGPTAVADSGGGGAGRGEVGGRGGEADVATGIITPGGMSGKRCIISESFELQGGSGGGAGSPGLSVDAASGGGGGGAIQITALGSLEITGTIQAGGAGGGGGPIGSVVDGDAGAGGGGGSGGAILIEAPAVAVGSGAVLAANGGGGGGGGSTAELGTPGENGRLSKTPAAGGVAAVLVGPGSGGNGGTATTAALPGSVGTSNANGGGGAVGTITIRGKDRLIGGTISPDPVEQDVDLLP